MKYPILFVYACLSGVTYTMDTNEPPSIQQKNQETGDPGFSYAILLTRRDYPENQSSLFQKQPQTFFSEKSEKTVPEQKIRILSWPLLPEKEKK